MGWDVVEIGLRHDLPIDDPIAAAEILSERLDANVSVIAECEIVFDENGKTLQEIMEQFLIIYFNENINENL